MLIGNIKYIDTSPMNQSYWSYLHPPNPSNPFKKPEVGVIIVIAVGRRNLVELRKLLNLGSWPEPVGCWAIDFMPPESPTWAGSRLASGAGFNLAWSRKISDMEIGEVM